MTAPLPATILIQLVDKCNDLIQSAARYYDENDFAVKSLQFECQKLINVDAALGYASKGQIASLYGDCDEMLHCYNNAEKLNAKNLIALDQYRIAGLANLGYFSKAYLIVDELLTPTFDRFSAFYDEMLKVGAFSKIFNHYMNMDAMNMEKPIHFPKELIQKSLDILHGSNVSDADIACMLDLAGVVLRRHKCFDAFQDAKQNIECLGEMSPCVHYRIGLAVDAKEVADANMELATLVAESDLPIKQAFHVSFVGV